MAIDLLKQLETLSSGSVLINLRHIKPKIAAAIAELEGLKKCNNCKYEDLAYPRGCSNWDYCSRMISDLFEPKVVNDE